MKRGGEYGKDPFKEYLRESEPDKAHKSYVWSTAIGLQAVDGLKPSKYLVDAAIQNIEGKITMKRLSSFQIWFRQILLNQYLVMEKENINSKVIKAKLQGTAEKIDCPFKVSKHMNTKLITVSTCII